MYVIAKRECCFRLFEKSWLIDYCFENTTTLITIQSRRFYKYNMNQFLLLKNEYFEEIKRECVCECVRL
jgi:hypothetical protein